VAVAENNHIASRLVLGTAQLGMPYGIANRAGQPDRKMATEIVRVAWKSGIREFDTAQGYGDSEDLLGKAFRALGITDQARVITKLVPETGPDDRDMVRSALQQSLDRLGVGRLYGVMLHRESLLDQWQAGLEDTCRQIVKEGLTEHIGVSVYSPARALQALLKEKISMIQLPANILDARFERAGVFEMARQKRKTIYVRSIYLQGLLLMQSNDLPRAMEFAKPVLRRVEELSAQMGYSRQELAMAFAASAYPMAKLVVGAETSAQVLQNARFVNTCLPKDHVELIRDTFIGLDEKILNPAQWPGS
jgi:aryl-alcohol dehydrogenase-like predicted oxidoreductase